MKCINQPNILHFVRKVHSNRALNALIQGSSSCIKYPKFNYAGRNHIIEGQKQLQSISDFYNGIQAIYRSVSEYAALSVQLVVNCCMLSRYRICSLLEYSLCE